jgi:hypothetical protein
MESDMKTKERQPTLRELFEIGRDNAARIFHDVGEVSPIWHAVPEYGDHMLIATPWSSDDEKDIAMEFLRYKFKEENVMRFVCVLEAWAVMAGDPKTLMNTRPSKHPDRREVIRIQAEDRDGSVLSGQFYILRPEHGPATLSRFHEDPSGMTIAGRMSGLLAETRH